MVDEVKKRTFVVIRLKGLPQIWDGPDYQPLLRMTGGEFIHEFTTKQEALDHVAKMIDDQVKGQMRGADAELFGPNQSDT